jgi:hypothetical protein
VADIDLTQWGEGAPFEFVSTYKVTTPFAVSGTVSRCPRCARLGVEFRNEEARAFLHKLHADEGGDVLNWSFDLCRLTVAAQAPAAPDEVPAPDAAGRCMCGHPRALHPGDGACRGSHDPHFPCPRYREARG